MRTPAQLRKEAARARLRAELLRKSLADEERLAAMLEAEAVERERGLRDSEQTPIVTAQMDAAHRTAISASMKKADAKFGAAVNAAGFSIRSLAEKLGVSQATLHAHRKARGNKNGFPIPKARARQVEKLIGWPADAEHWPCGIRDGE